LKALILASGTGSRLRPLTNDRPKCLINLKNEKTILELQLNAFQKASIKDIVITTGPFEIHVIDFLKSYKHNLNIKLVNNELYKKTNYIYSMYKAKNYLDNDIILIHGDLVFVQGNDNSPHI